MGAVGHGKVESLGWPPSRGPGHRRLGSRERSGALSLQELPTHLQRLDQDADGATAQERAMARPRPGDDRGNQRGGGAKRCDVHPTTAFRWRHRFLGSAALDKPKTLTGIVEADEMFILESFKGRRSDLPRRPRNRGGKAKHPASSSKTFRSSSRATATAQLSTRCCPMSIAPRSPRRSRAW